MCVYVYVYVCGVCVSVCLCVGLEGKWGKGRLDFGLHTRLSLGVYYKVKIYIVSAPLCRRNVGSTLAPGWYELMSSP